MTILLFNKFLYPKGGDAIVTPATGGLLRARWNEVVFWGIRHYERLMEVYQSAIKAK